MQLTAGERIVIHGRTVGATERHGVVLEVRGDDGTPPYWVRFDDGHEGLIFPGPDFEIERLKG